MPRAYKACLTALAANKTANAALAAAKDAYSNLANSRHGEYITLADAIHGQRRPVCARQTKGDR
jgi:hypothetical protein